VSGGSAEPHRSSDRVHGSPGPDATHDRQVRRELAAFVRDTATYGTVGLLAATAVFAGLAREYLGLGRLLPWLALVTTSGIVALVGLTVPSVRRWADGDDVPRLLQIGYLGAGAAWGFAVWLDLADDATEYRWLVLVLLATITTGQLGLVGIPRPARLLYIPMWLIAAVGFVVAGQPIVAVGCVTYVAIVLPQHAMSSSHLRELVRLRIESIDQASTAAWAATHDPLTGLLNRSGLVSAASDHVSDRRNRHTTALFIDLDHFKEVNDRFGHAVGDQLLVALAHRLRETLRPDDVLARLGGDEFVVLTARALDDDAAAELAERVITSIEEPFDLGDVEVYVSASIGVTRVDRTTSSIDDLLKESDHALSHAKRTGRRQAVVFDEELEAQLREQTGLEMALRKAIRSREIEAWGQPVFDTRTGEVAWVELLARWEVQPGVRIPPAVFVELAEEIGMADDLGRMMLEHAARALQRWRRHPVLARSSVGVNISALHIARADLVGDISGLAVYEGLDASRLIIELTESQRVNDIDEVRRTFEQLATAGVRLAVDDFGSGYSSLGQLLALPVSIVKLDRELIAGADLDGRRTNIVRAIHLLASALGHTVLAEGIETDGEQQVAATIGIDQVQGFLFCPPLPLPQLEEELASHFIPAPIIGTSVSLPIERPRDR
jgi:diguanylate cyclase (GGDEF)-like protein